MTVLDWLCLAVTLALSVTAIWISARTRQRILAAQAARHRRSARQAWGRVAAMELLALKAERAIGQTGRPGRRA
ncbi:hypothetical protein [Streptomyces sp. STCH 565 A]|uniref:hypothetical protein n=1 Tax=Streptomyces sp. STCH 565 A TaxID=2950532 RepID=UPI0020763E40|nr:hypothetical protein [Streptomyces sp. STCH 565 A]MCM8552270.1 hypothetical protein [Streptomyces sp. STCH 565 A]